MLISTQLSKRTTATCTTRTEANFEWAGLNGHRGPLRPAQNVAHRHAVADSVSSAKPPPMPATCPPPTDAGHVLGSARQPGLLRRPPRCPHHPPVSVGSPCSQPDHLPAAGVEPAARCCQSWPSQFGDQIRFAQRPTTLQKNWSCQLHTSATPVSTPPEEPRTGVKLLCARLERAHQFFPVHSPCNDNARDGALHQQSAHQRSTAKSRPMSTKRHSQ